MRRVPLAIVGIVTFAACAPPAPRPQVPHRSLPAPRVIRVGIVEKGHTIVRQVPLEDYVKATVISEFAPANGDLDLVTRMLEVQAVIARTYALAHITRHKRDGYDLCSTTHCQLFEPGRLKTSRWAAAAAAGTAKTAAQVLWYGSGPASALFHSDCGGRTSRPADVWGGSARPYLVSVEDDGPAEFAHSMWRVDADIADVRRALNADARTRVGERFDGMTVLDRDPAGRAMRVAIHARRDRIVRGEDVRDVLARAFGARRFKSTWFDVQRRGSTLTFEGRGFGHGVGLCQAGALARLRAGATLPDVLRRYYPGTTLVSLSSRKR